MKTTSLVSLLSIACSAIVLAESQEAAKQLQVYPKNVARQHLGANLFHFDATRQTYAPTEASAAWLDDDITTGWPVLAGRHYYMLALPQAELLRNFSISTRPSAGTVTLYAGDEPSAPGAASWTVVAKDVPLDSVNEQKLAKPFSRLAKYLLIETNVEDPGPVFSLYAYTDRPAVVYDVRKRDKAIDARSIFGPYVNEQTTFNVAGLYAQGVVQHASSPDGFVSWQKAVDDNPESSLRLPPSTDQAGASVRLKQRESINRISVLTDAGVSGKVDFYLTDTAAAEGVTASATDSSVQAAASLQDRIPTVSIDLDGSNPRTSIDFPQVEASELLVRWTPANGTDTLNLRELNAFGTPTVATYAVTMRPEAIAELTPEADALLADNSKDGKEFKDVKDPKDFKEAKDAIEPIGELARSPYLPGSLGFPPNLTSRLAPNRPLLPPETPVSP